MHECDLLIAVGARFDDRVTGKLDGFAPHAKHHPHRHRPGRDRQERARRTSPSSATPARAAELLKELEAWSGRRAHRRMAGAHSREWQERVPASYETHGRHAHAAVRGRRRSTSVTGGDAVICTDVGQHQMWATQYYHVQRPRTFISSGGLGTMGFGLPAAIGAQFGRPGQDGRRHQRRRRLPDEHAGDGHGGRATTCRSRCRILNNGYLGMVRQWQELFWNKRYSPPASRCSRTSSCWPRLSVPWACGSPAPDQVEPALRDAIAASAP